MPENRQDALQGLLRAARAGLERLVDELEAAGTILAIAERVRALAGFSGYSLSNVLLIRMQRPSATVVASQTMWARVGRAVIQGEKPISIVCPIPRTGTRPAFTVGETWDVLQTRGEPIPMPSAAVEVRDADFSMVTQVEQAISRRWPVQTFTPPAGRHGLRGFADAAGIHVADDLDFHQHVRVVLHEGAHLALGHVADGAAGRASRELEADAVSVAACAAIGLDVSAASRRYLAAQGVTRDDLRAALPRVHRAVRVLIDIIEAPGPGGGLV